MGLIERLVTSIALLILYPMVIAEAVYNRFTQRDGESLRKKFLRENRHWTEMWGEIW